MPVRMPRSSFDKVRAACRPRMMPARTFEFADGAYSPRTRSATCACSSQHPAVGAAPSSGRFLRHEESLFCDRLCPTVASTVDCGDRRIDRALGQPFELQVPAPVPAAHTQRSPLLSPAFVRGEALNSPFIGRVAILHRPPSTIFALQLSLHYSSVGSQAHSTPTPQSQYLILFVKMTVRV